MSASAKALITTDARMLEHSGIGAYLKDLLENFASLDHEFRFRVLSPTHERMAGLSPERFEFVRATAPAYSLREQWEIARLARGAALLHCPHYNIPLLYRGRLVVTIHDLTHLIYPEFLPARHAYLYARFMLSAAAKRACRIITVSEFSKKTIVERLRVPEERIRVIYNALPAIPPSPQPSHDDAALLRLGIRKPYVLFVGLLKPHKNLERLIRAFALLPKATRDEHRLVLAGKKDSDYPKLQRLVSELTLGDRVVFPGRVSDSDLASLYTSAAAFVLPSLIEGFGIPALEAMAYGVPVIASDSSSLPEVVGDAGILVNPSNAEEIASALEQVLSNGALRQQMAERGRQRAKMFSRNEFARRHLEVYRDAGGGRP